MNRVEGVSLVFQINFTVKPHKQKDMIHALMNHSGLMLSDLAVLIGFSIEKMRAVFLREDFFNEEEALKLVQCFCMAFGE
ncbi:MAG: hypothetical protein A3F10_04855 [Coxiella sp. RIFCSPHIGHO2_12_FULL_42_15]|nr:MAG: hypothetical protein A3F10_04855 [Coxiella sp. RIFCSPHIGHO2_12_FULL_42_15]